MKKVMLYAALLGGLGSPAYASDNFETYGDIVQFAVPAFAAGLSLYQGDYDGLASLGYSLASTMATVSVLKNTVDTTRPNGSTKSFPSGHTAFAFSGASYVQVRYGWGYGLPAYVAAATVGWSRVESDSHYWRDVIAGAAIGTGFSYLFTSPVGTQLAFYPVLMDGDARGLGFSMTY